MYAIADVSDGWERFANALSPTAPFPKRAPRSRLGLLLVPLLLTSLYPTSYMIMKIFGFFLGLGFFGDP